jgi:putative ABC transport system permease protein
MAIYSKPHSVTSFVDLEKMVFDLRYTEGPYWEILDFDFIEGGPYTPEDERNANPVTVITEATRRRYFGDRSVLGELIETGGQRFRVVGVVHNVPVTRMTAAADLWAPLSTAKSQEFRTEIIRGFHALLLAGSRKDFPAIKAEFESRLKHVELPEPYQTIYGTPMTRLEFAVVSLDTPSDGRPPVLKVVLIWLGLVAVFLLLPTINLVNINLSRILERSPEIGIRKAFGASSLHLAGQFIFENLFLSLLGSVLALAGAAGVLSIIESSGLIPYADFKLNYRVFFYALILACFFGLLSGAFPAWRMSRLNPVNALRGGKR